MIIKAVSTENGHVVLVLIRNLKQLLDAGVENDTEAGMDFVKKGSVCCYSNGVCTNLDQS